MADLATPRPDADPVPLLPALSLALCAAISLGLARFSYALLLPPMRAELHWSYFTAGAMNTANAAGYFLGALVAARWLARHDALRVAVAGGVVTAIGLAAHGLVAGDVALYALRIATGAAGAATFVGGGLLAARLAQASTRPGRVVGLYYGGAGLGILASTALVPPLPWRAAWMALAVAALVASGAVMLGVRRAGALLDTAPAAAGDAGHAPWRPMGAALAGYGLFGIGYIGYMTFIVTLLREQGVATAWIDAFYALLGSATVVSSWLWAGLLQRARGGGAIALLNALLAVATLVPALGAHPVALALSAALFGGTFLSVVAATTAFVRRNLPPAAWARGIGAFTIVFAAGQIIGPSLAGRLADGPGGLARGFVLSAVALALGALVAWRQRPLKSQP